MTLTEYQARLAELQAQIKALIDEQREEDAAHQARAQQRLQRVQSLQADALRAEGAIEALSAVQGDAPAETEA